MRRITFLGVLLPSSFLLAITLAPVAGQDNAPPKPQPPGEVKLGEVEKGMQIENHGPVHEAFAQPGAQTRGKGVTAPKAPPPQVPELPPEEKPGGANVVWIPGYWQWDLERKDYLWVSGLWRNVPDGRTWEAGQWREKDGAWEYVPGFWKRTNQPLGRHDLPEPPESVENGPNTPAPHEDAFWRPGHWEFRDNRYLWVPGYWAEPEGNLIWQPGQYCYSGSGYRYIPGYWDYCLEDRGLLFAPVYFSSPLWNTPGWCFRPSWAINIGLGGGWGWGWGGFYSSLFIGPGCGSFYFGNYFSPWCWGAGFRPWCWSGRGFNNPCFRHYCWLNRGNAGWSNGVKQTYVARSFGAVGQPPRTFAAGAARGGAGAGLASPAASANLNRITSRVGGESAARALDERVFRGQTVRQVDQAVKQTGSMNVVQPAKEVNRAQEVARSLPVRTAESSVSRGSRETGRSLDAYNQTMTRRDPSAGTISERAMRQRMTDAARTTPLTRNEASARELSNVMGKSRAGGETSGLENRTYRFEQPGGREMAGRSSPGMDLPSSRSPSLPARDRGMEMDRSFSRGSFETSRLPRDMPSARAPMSSPSMRGSAPSMSGASMSRGMPSGGGFRGGAMPSGGGRAGGGGGGGGGGARGGKR